jgi:hypothetical protein
MANIRARAVKGDGGSAMCSEAKQANSGSGSRVRHRKSAEPKVGAHDTVISMQSARGEWTSLFFFLVVGITQHRPCAMRSSAKRRLRRRNASRHTPRCPSALLKCVTSSAWGRYHAPDDTWNGCGQRRERAGGGGKRRERGENSNLSLPIFFSCCESRPPPTASEVGHARPISTLCQSTCCL